MQTKPLTLALALTALIVMPVAEAAEIRFSLANGFSFA